MAFTEHIIGKREQISWGTETTFGTAVTPTEIVGLNVVITPNFRTGWQEILQSGADSLNIVSMQKGPRSYEFQMEFIPVSWKFLKYVMGSSTDNDEGAYYSHTIALSDTIQTFTLEWAKRSATNHVITLVSVSVKKCKIAWSKPAGEGNEGFIKVILDCVAKTATSGTAITSLSAPTKVPYQFRMTKLTVGSSEIVRSNSGELNLDRGVDPQDSRYANSTLDVDIGETIPKTFRIGMMSNINITDSTFYNYWAAATVIGSTNTLEFIRGANDKITFTFTNAYPIDGTAATNLEGVDNVDFGFTAVSVAPVANDDITSY